MKFPYHQIMSFFERKKRFFVTKHLAFIYSSFHQMFLKFRKKGLYYLRISACLYRKIRAEMTIDGAYKKSFSKNQGVFQKQDFETNLQHPGPFIVVIWKYE